MYAALRCFTFREYAIAVLLFVAVSGCADNELPPQSVATSTRDDRWNLKERLKKGRELIDNAKLEADKLVVDRQSGIAFQIDDFHVAVLDGLSKLPGVISVTASDADQPTSRIIHLISSEIPSKDDCFVALKQMADGGVSQTQLDSLYDEYILQITLMQIEHAVIVRCLMRSHRLRRVYVECKSHDDFLLSENGLEVGSHDNSLEGNETSRKPAVAEIHWMKGLQGGLQSEFQLWEINEVPNSVSGSSESIFKSFKNSAKVIQKRSNQMMDAQVRSILTDDSCCLLIGDDNDFTENVNRISNRKCEYIRIKTKCWQSTSLLDPNIWGR